VIQIIVRYRVSHSIRFSTKISLVFLIYADYQRHSFHDLYTKRSKLFYLIWIICH